MRLAITVVVVVTLVGSGLLASWAEGDRRGPVANETADDEPSRESSVEIQLAGSGANVPLTRRLAAAFEGDAHVHDSVGSGGGLRALADGVVNLALVSRPLSARERADRRVVAYARTPIVFAVHRGVAARTVTTAQLEALFRGTSWSDGTHPVLLLREPGDSAVEAVRAVSAGLAEAHDEAVAARRGAVLLSDARMRSELDVPDALGLTDLGQLRVARSNARALTIDGVAATLENMRAGRYPYSRELMFVARPDDERAATFLDFVRSERGQAVIREAGYAP